jgi:hypothetical protein
MIAACLSKLRVGEELRPNFFKLKFSPAQRQTITYELLQIGFTYRDVATLLGVTVQSAYWMAQRAREDMLVMVGPAWIPANFLDDYNTLKSDAAWLRSKSETASTEELEQAARHRAGTLTAKAADLLIDMSRTNAIERAMREANGAKSTEAPDPNDRINMLQWVFENKIMKQIEPPEPTEAELAEEKE